MSILFFFVVFTRWLILYNYFSASVPVSVNSISSLCFLRALYHSSPILRCSKLKFSFSSSELDSFVALAFKSKFFLGFILTRWSQDH